MTLFVISLVLGLLPAWRGGLVAILVCAWAVAGVISAALFLAPGEMIDTIAAVFIVFLGFNAGITAGFGLKLVSIVRNPV